MRKWKYNIDLFDIYKEYSEYDEEDFTDDILFTEMKTKVVDKLKTYSFPYIRESFEDLIYDLSESINLEEWEYNFDLLYDWADDNDVWIKTIIL